MTSGLAALTRMLACALSIAIVAPAAAPARASLGPAFAVWDIRVEEKDESCGQGKATKDFGWKVVAFGVDTLKYLIGLFIIPIGLFLVVVGAVLEIVEAVAC